MERPQNLLPSKKFDADVSDQFLMYHLRRRILRLLRRTWRQPPRGKTGKSSMPSIASTDDWDINHRTN